jgi:hypothetical protein
MQEQTVISFGFHYATRSNLLGMDRTNSAMFKPDQGGLKKEETLLSTWTVRIRVESV